MKSGFVSLIGRPNAGKSTLLNNIMERKIAIMSDKPQTTRNRITAIYTSDEAQIIYIDTPGIHKPRHKLGEYMVNTAKDSLEDVDIIYYLVDASKKFGRGEEFILEQLKLTKTPVFLVLNKIDLIKIEDLLGIIDFWQNKFEFAEIFPLSALKGDNIEVLVEKTIDYLEEGPMYYPEDAITDQPQQVVMGELIREKVLQLTREEVPHSVAVVIEMMNREEAKLFVSATIYVERDSQKKIIIGKGGSMLKRIGTLARKDIEMLLGEKIYLDLWIKVKKDWRNKEGILKNFGYNLDNA